MKATVGYADDSDFGFLSERHSRIAPDVLKRKISGHEVFVARLGNDIVGWMTYTLLYDTVPFINLLVVAEEHRGQGVGTQMVRFFEGEVERGGADTVMTSSAANEQGQHFWRKMGYRDVGGVLLGGHPIEVFFWKDLAKQE